MIRCPICENILKVPLEFFGETCECPYCDHEIELVRSPEESLPPPVAQELHSGV